MDSSVIENLPRKLWIGGKWLDGVAGETMDVINPTNSKSLGKVVRAGLADVELAYQAAEKAFPAWYALGWRKRAEILWEFAEQLKKNRELLAYIDTVDSGNPIAGMRIDVDISVDFIREYIYMQAGVTGSTYEASNPMNLHYTRYEPYGVVGRIFAYNHPMMFAATRIIPALLTGNAIVMKPSDVTPLSVLALAQIMEQVFPEGVINILTGDVVTGQGIVKHPKIKRIAFTGSTGTGMKIQADAASVAVKHISLELGGKNPQIVFPDVDVDAAVKGALIGMNYGVCQGQSCGSNSRIFLHRDIYATFMQKLTDKVAALRTGDPLDAQVQIGPMVSAAHQKRVLGYIASGQEQGARLTLGGDRPTTGALGHGFYVTPAVMEDVTMDMRIAKEEIFGPVMSILPWDNLEDMLVQANDVEYGLTASVWTNDLRHAHLTANRLKAGYVWINDTNRHYPGTPFGGYKNSGLGREESVDELKSYCEQKVVHTILQP